MERKTAGDICKVFYVYPESTAAHTGAGPVRADQCQHRIYENGFFCLLYRGSGSNLHFFPDDHNGDSGSCADPCSFLFVITSDRSGVNDHFSDNVHFLFRVYTEEGMLVLISALAFGLKIPLVVPVVFGLMGTPVWIVPACCGVIAYYMVDFVKDSAAALRSTDADALFNSLMSFTRQVLTSREMWLMAATVVVGILVVNLVRTRAVDHAWKIASAAGAVVSVIIAAAGNMALGTGVSYVSIAVSACLGILVGLVLEFLFFSVDYSRTENIQFEDDEYYYYVKAVPKVGVSAPEKEVKRITGNKPQKQEDHSSDENANTNTEDILLTRSLSKELGLDQEKVKTE